MKTPFQNKPGGFTLLEILVVAALVAMVLALSVPSYNRIKDQGYATQCTAKLRQIGIGITDYLAENGLVYPVLAQGRESRDDDKTPVLETVLLPYVNDEMIFQCPSDHEQFFERTGSSYFWNSLINGQKLGQMNLLGIVKQEAGIPLVSDKENFHKHIGGEVNILYADGHILKELKFTVEMD